MTMVQIDGEEIARRVFGEDRADEVDLSTLTLDELAERANAHHGRVLSSARTTLAEALIVGDAILALRDRLGDDWKAWADANLKFSKGARSYYMRLAHYKHLLPSDALGVKEAQALLAGLPEVGSSRVGREVYPSAMKRLACTMRADNLSLNEVASRLDVAVDTVRLWTDEGYADRRRKARRDGRRRRTIERRALQEQQKRDERDRLAREKGGNLGKAYDAVRKLQPIIDGAVAEGLSVEARALTVRLEDEIFKALKR